MSASPAAPRYWAVIPAAGAGRRMGSDLPKQYLPLRDKTVLEHTLARLATHPCVAGILVVLTPGDPYWSALALDTVFAKPLFTAKGGAERCHSVFNGLAALQEIAGENDWVLVHDAARPCVRHSDISALIERLRDDPAGGLLGAPVTDTVKRTYDSGVIRETVPRENLWRAFTPQMFRLGALHSALGDSLARGTLVTDEAAAMEMAGHGPRMVEGHSDNIKITRPQDLPLAEYILERQEHES